MSDIDCNKKSFAELIRDYNITIPLIQREYAQGRDNEQGQEVRKNFVPNLIEVLTGDEKSLELDFVFGVKKSAEANNEILIPLDGQQRLTTLLLLHWNFGAHRNKNWAFTYKSRRMANLNTQEFLIQKRSVNGSKNVPVCRQLLPQISVNSMPILSKTQLWEMEP